MRAFAVAAFATCVAFVAAIQVTMTTAILNSPNVLQPKSSSNAPFRARSLSLLMVNTAFLYLL
jgi:hypothetical protein